MRYQTLTPIIGDFPEISVTLICLPLTAEDLPSIWTCWVPELRGKLPLRQAMRWDELALSLASKLRRTGLPQKHYPIIFWIIFPDTRFGKKIKKKEMKNESLHSQTALSPKYAGISVNRIQTSWTFLRSLTGHTYLSPEYFHILEEKSQLRWAPFFPLQVAFHFHPDIGIHKVLALPISSFKATFSAFSRKSSWTTNILPLQARMHVSFNEQSLLNKMPSSHGSLGMELQFLVQSSNRQQFCSRANNALSLLVVRDKVGTSFP